MEEVRFGVSKTPLFEEEGKPARSQEDTPTPASLRKLVARFTTDEMLRQDLLQECLLCLWRAEREGPARTRSWYLQNCRFRIQHWLEAGRSLDSPKRARGDRRVSLDDAGESALTENHINGEIFEAISFRDVLGTLARHLGVKEQAVLRGLADGLVLQEIAAQCELSYPTALKYRRKIAGLTIKLGIAAVRPAPSSLSPTKE